MMQLGVDGVFVGSGIFKSSNPKKRAEAIVQAVVHYDDPKTLAEVSEDLGEAMVSVLCIEILLMSIKCIFIKLMVCLEIQNILKATFGIVTIAGWD